MVQQSLFNRITLIVLDGAGIGAMPDAPEWGDAGSDTFGHICESRQLNLPNLQSLGSGIFVRWRACSAIDNPRGAMAKCALKSNGKDTTTGHWEMAGSFWSALSNLSEWFSAVSD
jgi:phosphopentomutase